jgi:hypothetical protein
LLTILTTASLLVAVFFSHVMGSFLTVEIEHHHHADGDHHHANGVHYAIHHDDSSHHKPSNPPDGDNDQENDSTPEGGTHSHVVSIGADGPLVCFSHPRADFACWVRSPLSPSNNPTFPDGPTFDLIKPPQLG